MKTNNYYRALVLTVSGLGLHLTGTAQNTFPSSGFAGIGTTSPVTSLTIQTPSTNDGVRIYQTGGTAASVGLFNNGTGARNYALFSTGPGNGEGAGHFGLYDYSGGGYRMFFQAGTGNVGFGTGSSALTARVQSSLSIASASSVFTAGLFEANMSVDGVPTGVKGVATNQVGATQNLSRGVWGIAQTPNISGNFSSYNHGVYGTATGGHYNVGGTFEATASGTARTAIGIVSSYTVSAGASGWSAYFNGNTYCSGSYTTSDRKLKNNIEPFTNALDKLLLLKPSTYVFRKDEFKAMNLPEGNQIGLIAQELETVFPELVREVPGLDLFDENGKVSGKLPSLKSVNYEGLIPVLIAAVQEQQKQINEQQATIAELKRHLPSDDLLSGNAVEAKIRLYQNEPNPFSRETTIRYYVPESIGEAYIVVYDMTGKQLLTVPLTQKGENRITVASNSLSAGMFMYAIIANNKLIDSKRMIITD